MSNGANYVHKQLCKELENYIKSQYFGKTPLLLSAVTEKINKEGVLYQKPYIESSPAYKSKKNGIQFSNIPDWLKKYFDRLSEAKLGVYPTPFLHQLSALEASIKGDDLFVATGTGSGKTECFMWPLMAKLVTEAKETPSSWSNRGIRSIIMYPMNALVSDQVSRLRRLIGDPENKFVKIFRDTCLYHSRRPQFGMYTGRTPYPGIESEQNQDRLLEKNLARMSFPKTESEERFLKQLLNEGRIPAKYDMKGFLKGLHNGNHIPNEEDAELITRFEMQQFCPDILITNYSMLEYMLLRPREEKIWKDTKKWLNCSEDNKLLFVIDEAHMYRGSSGGEVSLLLRRLFYKLGITRNKVQFILTTASMPDRDEEDRNAIMKFANELTASDSNKEFCYLTGEREDISGLAKYNIPFEKFKNCNPSDFEDKEDIQFVALKKFWNGISNETFSNLQQVYDWMYNHLIEYKQFHKLFNKCRGNAVSLNELYNEIFPETCRTEGLKAVSVLLAIAPLAKNYEGTILFPARMHMFFRGINGVYACVNPNCDNSHSDETLTLGEIYLSDGNFICPKCKSVVYELYNDRRCGALFYKGFILKENNEISNSTYLWHYPGQLLDRRVKEIHLFIPTDDFELSKGRKKYPIKACYLDIKSGFINFKDDSQSNNSNYRKLYYCDYSAKGRPQVITFPTCPHCRHQLSSSQLTSFSTRGNQSFFNLIKSQFQVQPAVPGKDNDPDRLPNEGRKVLIFSDSRQRAAKLARDMSEASDIMAVHQLFALAINMMEKSNKEYSMEYLYDYFCIVAAQNKIKIFNEPEREWFIENCDSVLNKYNRSLRRKREYSPELIISNAPIQMQKYLLRLYAGGYNTLYDSAISWIEPTDEAMFYSLDELEENGIIVTENEFLELFNAWMINICDSSTALGQSISDDTRSEVRSSYDGYGLKKDWSFSKAIASVMDWKNDSEVLSIWKRTLINNFLDMSQFDHGKYYVSLSKIKPRFDLKHKWYRCECCSEITPYLLKKCCPSCGTTKIHYMDDNEIKSLEFWRKPIDDAISGKKIYVIDTEEHTAQVSHKDQRDAIWSKTEKYELRFQDLLQKNETPVDILSSTTTMEVGIDIGSLVAVGLRNIPPLRENYQQRAGRAGRRGSSLSTIVTFCEDGPHDTLYFKNPVPMLRGDPRKPWIDTKSNKLIQRHLAMVIFCEYLSNNNNSLDFISAAEFLDYHLFEFSNYLKKYVIRKKLIPNNIEFDYSKFCYWLNNELIKMKNRRDEHPELFGVESSNNKNTKSLLDALYEEGIIPTYSFPKNIVSTYITDENGRVRYEISRGLDVAIGEYAPGRAIVVDKQTYQIGGLYFPNSDKRKGLTKIPARAYVEDPNYLKEILSCPKCGWFGLKEESLTLCPFCSSKSLISSKPLLRPWGFAPKDGKSISEAQLIEQYTSVQQPLYSTLPNSSDMISVANCDNIRIASRTNQRIIMMNKGVQDCGFMVCKDCGASMPGDDEHVLNSIYRPYNNKYAGKKCNHLNTVNVNLGFDFITDMLVLEFFIDSNYINVDRNENLWLERAGQSLAEAMRLAASKHLDVEFTELVTGYRIRENSKGSFIDIYLYDSLSSGAGYADSIANDIEEILIEVEDLLKNCDCSSSCHNCLRNYRNQFVHGLLDRFAALELLQWGKNGTVASALNFEKQVDIIKPLCNILSSFNCILDFSNKKITITKDKFKKTLVVYPAMWSEKNKEKTIYLRDSYIKYSKPFAVQKILDEIAL